jgi:hypothetical protein
MFKMGENLIQQFGSVLFQFFFDTMNITSVKDITYFFLLILLNSFLNILEYVVLFIQQLIDLLKVKSTHLQLGLSIFVFKP